MIDGYSFGHITVDGKSYLRDLIILPERIVTNWWRKQGHRLITADLDEIFDSDIDKLVIGTGAYGLMKVDEETKDSLKKKGIEFFVAPTREAVNIYNKLEGKKAACFHLTC